MLLESEIFVPIKLNLNYVNTISIMNCTTDTWRQWIVSLSLSYLPFLVILTMKWLLTLKIDTTSHWSVWCLSMQLGQGISSLRCQLILFYLIVYIILDVTLILHLMIIYSLFHSFISFWKKINWSGQHICFSHNFKLGLTVRVHVPNGYSNYSVVLKGILWDFFIFTLEQIIVLNK